MFLTKPIDGNDFDGVLSILTFEPQDIVGDMECVRIDIIDDDYKEDNESFTFAIRAEDDSDIVHINDFSADVYIIDDDGKAANTMQTFDITVWCLLNPPHMAPL